MSPMKKLVLGCLGVTLLVAIAGGVLGYVYIVRPAREYLVALGQLGSLSELEKQVRNQGPFEPPESGELSPELVERFARVRQSVQRSLGAQFARLAERVADLEEAATSSGRVGVRDLFAASHNLAKAVGDAKRAQVAALNEAGISLAEYEWVEQRMYEAAGMLVSSLDVEALRAALASGAERVELKRPEPGPVPDRNRELVAPYLDRLKEWLPLTWLGL